MRYDSLTTSYNRFVREIRLSGYVRTYVDSFPVRDSFSRQRSDVNYIAIDSTGWRAPSSYFAGIHDENGLDLYGEWISPSNGYRYLVNTTAWPVSVTQSQLIVLAPTGAQIAQVESRALNNVADRKASFNESLLELRRTVKGLADNASTINRFVTAAASRNWGKAARALGLNPQGRKARRARDRTLAAGGTFGAAWLNYHFGLAPIVSDMVSMCILLSDEDVHKRLRVKGVSQITFPGKLVSTNHSWGTDYSAGKGNYVTDMRTLQRVRVSLSYTINAETLRRLTKYGVADAPQALWAVVPFSFVVDWLIPVSEVLRAYTATHGLTFKGGTLSTSVIVTKTLHSPVSEATAQRIPVFQPASGRAISTYARHNRSVYHSSPLPKSLWVKDPLDAWKAVTSLSLLAAAITNKLHSTYR